MGYLNLYIYVLFVTLDTFPLLHGHVTHAMSSNTFCNFLVMTLFSRPRMLYQFLGNKAEKGPSITTEVKVTLEQMYNGDSKGSLTLCFFLLHVLFGEARSACRFAFGGPGNIRNIIMFFFECVYFGQYIYKRRINMVQAISPSFE